MATMTFDNTPPATVTVNGTALVAEDIEKLLVLLAAARVRWPATGSRREAGLQGNHLEAALESLESFQRLETLP